MLDVSSKRGLERDVNFLVDTGSIAIVPRGTAICTSTLQTVNIYQVCGLTSLRQCLVLLTLGFYPGGGGLLAASGSGGGVFFLGRSGCREKQNLG